MPRLQYIGPRPNVPAHPSRLGTDIFIYGPRAEHSLRIDGNRETLHIQHQPIGVRVRIFVAYGYNPRDKWIEDSIRPIVEAFGSEFVHGGDLGGQPLTDGVRALIDSSDALLAFATRRDTIAIDQFATHRWVTDELSYAIGQGKQVLEIREEGVLDQGGLAGDSQRIKYREDDCARCLVEVIQTLGRWHRRSTRRFQLVPNDLVRPHLNKPYFRCRYRVLEEGRESLPREVPVQ